MAGAMRARFMTGYADSLCAFEKPRRSMIQTQSERPQYVICCAKSVRNACYVFAPYLSTRSLAFCTAVQDRERNKAVVVMTDHRFSRHRSSLHTPFLNPSPLGESASSSEIMSQETRQPKQRLPQLYPL